MLLLSLQDQLKEASESAVDLVKQYIALYDDDSTTVEEETNPWKNPEQMFLQLKEKRNTLNEIWIQYEKVLREVHNNNNDNQGQEQEDLPEEEFNVLYMDMITDAFGDVLDQMRTDAAGSTSADNVIEILVDCLQNGMEFIMEGNRNRQYLDSLEEDQELAEIPIHQMKQMELGYYVPPSSAEATATAAASET